MLTYMYTEYDGPTLLAVYYVGELTVINVNSMGYLASFTGRKNGFTHVWKLSKYSANLGL